MRKEHGFLFSLFPFLLLTSGNSLGGRGFQPRRKSLVINLGFSPCRVFAILLGVGPAPVPTRSGAPT